MMEDLNIGDISALLTVVFTCVITVANILMWLSTRRAIQLQTASNYSLNYQSLIQGHRDLFFGLWHQPELFAKFTQGNDLDKEQWELEILSTFFINQVLTHYVNFENGTLDKPYLDSFKKDAREVLTLPLINKRWQQVKQTYPPGFQHFVDRGLLEEKP